MSGNTGLLTSMCDPYGMESSIRLMGGIYAENMAGKHKWYCGKRADAGRFRFTCTGGPFGGRQAADGGLVAGTICDGGHEGPPMPLCRAHVAELTGRRWGPGFDSSMRPRGTVGGTRVVEGCPRCFFPPEARSLQEQAEQIHMEMSKYEVMGLGLAVPGKLIRAMNDVRARLDELNATGVVHKCPLILREVS